MPKKQHQKTSIFDYGDYREYLRDRFDERKRQQKFFSHRYFAQKAGLKTSSFLTAVIQRKRNLTIESIRKFAKGLNLNSLELEFFEALVLFNQAATHGDKQTYYEKMVGIKNSATGSKIEQKQLEYYSKWFVPIIREMVNLPTFQPSGKWISENLLFDVPPKETARAIKLLKDLGFIQQNESGDWSLTDKYVTTDPEIKSVMVARFHKEMIPLAGQAIDRIPPKDREISCLTASMSEKCFAEIKTMVGEFKNEIIKKILADEGEERVYQLNFDLFPLIKNQQPSTKKQEN